MKRAVSLACRGREPPLQSWTTRHFRRLASTTGAQPLAKTAKHGKENKPVRANIISRSGQTILPKELDSLILQKLFFVPAFKPYLGLEGVELRGLYNYGPPGAELQDNILDVWRKHFILEEDMLKVDCPAITPYEVFKTSGHVEKFTDFMCKDTVTGEHYRADHLVKEELEKRLSKSTKDQKTATQQIANEYRNILSNLDNYSCADLADVIKSHSIPSPSGNSVEPPIPTNLMFETAIGPSGKTRGYLRPETAQGQFLMFQELLEYNNQAMPFASASIGKSYRNEISPRSGILRLREFLMAEIEHFMDPEAGKLHPRFAEVENIELALLTRESQLSGGGGETSINKMTIGKAVADGVVNNQTLGYFLARTYLFMLKIGIDPARMRFRQHMSNEMAHYAVDCWDVELKTSYGWIECAGLADRSAYDLTAHSKRTGEQLEVRNSLGSLEEVEEIVPIINLGQLGPRFKQDSKAVQSFLLSQPQPSLELLASDLEHTGTCKVDIGSKVLPLGSDLVTFEKKKVTKPAIRTYTPSIIEPSFGIGRILYALMEHCIDRRDGADQARLVLSFPPLVAPTKVLIVPLQLNRPGFMQVAKRVQRQLRDEDISNRVDASGASIGKRYSRNDSVGIPLGITVDFQSLEDETVTLRDRDSMKQVRGSVDEVCKAIVSIVKGREQWADVVKRLPAFESTPE